MTDMENSKTPVNPKGEAPPNYRMNMGCGFCDHEELNLDFKSYCKKHDVVVNSNCICDDYDPKF